MQTMSPFIFLLHPDPSLSSMLYDCLQQICATFGLVAAKFWASRTKLFAARVSRWPQERRKHFLVLVLQSDSTSISTSRPNKIKAHLSVRRSVNTQQLKEVFQQISATNLKQCHYFARILDWFVCLHNKNVGYGFIFIENVTNISTVALNRF